MMRRRRFSILDIVEMSLIGTPTRIHGAECGTACRKASKRSGSRRALRHGSSTDNVTVRENVSLSAPRANTVA